MTNGKRGLPPLFVVCALLWGGCGDTPQLGPVFRHTSDVGAPARSGSVEYDAAARSYRLSGGGGNVWGTRDEFFYLWNRTSGDLRLEADVRFVGEGTDPHRKAGWMVRESLEPDAAYADVAVHGDGLVALQYRRRRGGNTEEVRSPLRSGSRVRLERTGDLFSLYLVGAAGQLEPVGSVPVNLPPEPLAGLFVCAHHPDGIEAAVFTDVRLENRVPGADEQRRIESTLEIIEIETGRREIVYRAAEHFEAPNWSPDGGYFVFNQGGRIYRLDVGGNRAEMIETGPADRCNNDHGFSPDGRWLAISHSPEGQSLIYVVPAEGGEPRLVTPLGPSYWHGWSPDGSQLAYCAERNGEYDVYVIPAEGGEEIRLTHAPGLDDGPDYTPDGRYIYFNSERTGRMSVWRMAPDGSGQERMTFDDDYADWFPHPSPDGRWVAFLSYDGHVQGHPPNEEVLLRLMPLEGGDPRVLARLFGGQGTINVPSWSPAGDRFAFVSYRLVLAGW
jgi:TolB protein